MILIREPIFLKVSSIVVYLLSIIRMEIRMCGILHCRCLISLRRRRPYILVLSQPPTSKMTTWGLKAPQVRNFWIRSPPYISTSNHVILTIRRALTKYMKLRLLNLLLVVKRICLLMSLGRSKDNLWSFRTGASCRLDRINIRLTTIQRRSYSVSFKFHQMEVEDRLLVNLSCRSKIKLPSKTGT